MNKSSSLSLILKGLLFENPVFILILGTCPTLATTTSVKGAVSMGLAAMAVLICSNIVISALRKLIPDTVRIPCYIIVIAGFVTVVEMLIHAYLPDVYELLGVYLALITVNCIILGRAEMFANKNTVAKSALDGVGMGLGFTAALFMISTVREIFGAASFWGIAIPFLEDYKISVLVQAPGGMMVYGFMIALVYVITRGKGPKKKSFSCHGCPSAALCHKADGCAKNETEVSDNA